MKYILPALSASFLRGLVVPALHPTRLVATALLAVAGWLLAPGASHAAVTPVAWYRLGENDPGALNGAAAAFTMDHIGNITMPLSGAPTYTDNLSAAANAIVGSSFGLDFPGNASGANDVVSTATDNFGIELWVKSGTVSGTQAIAYNGNAGSSGWGLYQFDDTYRGVFGGVAFIGSGVVTPGVWTHLALVRNNGTAILYVDGVASVTFPGAPLVPAGGFALGASLGGTQYLDGALDEVRVFTFAPGQFSTSDLLLNATPEIAVQQPAGTDIANGGSRNFGMVAVGANASLTFTIRNGGLATLTDLGITIDGPNTADFTVTAAPNPTVVPGGSTTFTVRFAPISAGTRTATLHLASNDPDENPFDIALTGTGTARPRIAIEQPVGTPLTAGVLAWGSTNYGQTMVPVAAQSGVIAIAAGYAHTVALKSDGRVLAWGANGYGQTNVPVAAQSGVIAIAAGGSHTVALKSDGRVLAWGWNDNGQTMVPGAAQSGVTAIAAGGEHTVALKSDGRVLAWGRNGNGQTTVPVAAQSGVTAIAAGGQHTVALKSSLLPVDFGDQRVSTPGTARTFTIRNSGNLPLTTTNVTVAGGQAADFTVNVTGLLTSVPAGGQTTFSVTFTPGAAGARQTTLRVLNNDLNPFDLTLTGVGVSDFVVPTPATPVLDRFDQLGRNRTGSNQYDGYTASGQAYTLVGGGNDIYNLVDEFAFAYHELAGDFDIRVQVTELEHSGFFSKAGLMVRESLAEDSRRVMQAVTPATGNNNTEFIWRTGLNNEAPPVAPDGGYGGENGGAHFIYGGPPSFPNAWIRLVRTGSVFEGFSGTDGSNWTSIASRDSASWQGGAMPGKLYVGLAVSRHPDAGANLTCRAVFNNYVETSLDFCVGEVSSLGYPNHVFVTYNRPVGPSALLAGNYTLTAGTAVTINSVTPGPRPEVVSLNVATLTEGTTYSLTVNASVLDAQGNALTADCRSGSFVHGAGFEARKIHLQHNRIEGLDASFYLESRAYAYGIGAASFDRRGFESNSLFEDVIPDSPSINWYSTRIFGVLSNSTGAALNARFACSSDDRGILFLSSDDQPAHRVEIAREPEWNNSRQYAAPDRRGPTMPNQSAPQTLAANSRHYLEYTYSEGNVGNNGSATWDTGSGSAFTDGQLPISETNFIPSRFAYGQHFYSLGPVVLLAGPANATVPAGFPATFSVAVDGTPPYEFTWKIDGTPVPGANSATLTLPNLAQGTIVVTVCVSNRLGGVSADATLTSLPLSIARSATSTDDVVLSWPFTRGVVLQESPSLSPATWTFAASGESTPTTRTATDPARFYRLFLVPVQPTPVPNMIFISPGTFTMGSPANEAGREANEGPQTTVTLTRGFWMGKYEVTQGEYQAVIGSNPSLFTGDLNRPVEQVSWNDATNYCARLTTRERTAGRLPSGWAYRLPTEAEWEYAARAGTTTRFSYGDDPDDTSLANYAWYADNSANRTHPVGQKLANPWGLFDMAGNVVEWCQDWYGNYPGGSATDPQGPDSGSYRVFRGGSWGYLVFGCRSADRNDGFSPDFRNSYFGFRVVLAPGQP